MVVAGAADPTAATDFLDFVLGAEGRRVLDRYGFLLNNLATASLQLISTLPLFLVLGLVPREHTTAAGGRHPTGGAGPCAGEHRAAAACTLGARHAARRRIGGGPA